MRNRTTEDTFCLLGGALLGAAAMYLLDPQAGEKRRARIAAAAEDAYENTRDAVAAGWDHVTDHAHRVAEHAQNLADRASDAGHSASSYTQSLANQAHDLAAGLTDQAASYIHGSAKSARKSARQARDAGWKWWKRGRDAAYDYADDAGDHVSSFSDAAKEQAGNLRDFGSRLWSRAKDLGGRVTDWGSSAADSAKDTADDYSDRARDWSHWFSKRASKAGRNASKQARHWWSRYQPEPEGFGTGTFVSTALGCCVAGVGAMYFFDPQRGRARRAWVADKTASLVNRTGHTMRMTGRDVANRLRGKAREARRAMNEYMESRGESESYNQGFSGTSMPSSSTPAPSHVM